MISQKVRCKMKHELQRGACLPSFHLLSRNLFFCCHDACLPGFHQWHLFCVSIFFVFLFLIFLYFVFLFIFCYYQGAYLLGFHQGNNFFRTFFLFFYFFIFFQDIKYVHGSSETRSALEPLQVESVDRLLEHFSFGY